MKIQKRGICACCGREQAVLSSGRMSKHGYTVDQGWFNGVCIGQKFKPMQECRKATDELVAVIRNEVLELEKQLTMIVRGELLPQTAASGPWHKAPHIPYRDAPELQQRVAYVTLKTDTERRIRAGKSLAEFLSRMADKWYGQPLTEVKIEDKPVNVFNIGDKRMTEKGMVITATSKQGARIYWKNERGFNGWTGSAAWNRMEKVE